MGLGRPVSHPQNCRCPPARAQPLEKTPWTPAAGKHFLRLSLKPWGTSMAGNPGAVGLARLSDYILSCGPLALTGSPTLETLTLRRSVRWLHGAKSRFVADT